MGANSGKLLACLVIVGLVILAIWLWGPLCALAGLFIIPATSEKAKVLENAERLKILATDPAVIVANQSSELRAGLDAANKDIVSAAVERAKHLGSGVSTN